MDSTPKTPPGAEADFTPDAAAFALHIGWQSAETAITLMGRGDFVASLTAAHAALKAIEAGVDSLVYLARVHG